MTGLTETLSAEDAAVATALANLEREMTKFSPHPVDGDDTAWQERKSAQTRIALLEAAVSCLADVGYAKTTTQLVAATAKISRGAMLHHYATKADLIAGVTDYILFRRMEMLYTEVSKLSEKQRVEQVGGLEVYWKGMQTPEYSAYLELMIASRTDPELDKIFRKRAKLYDDVSMEQLPLVFPEWAGKSKEKFRLACDLLIVTLEGLQINRRILSNRERRVAIRETLKDVLQMIWASED